MSKHTTNWAVQHNGKTTAADEQIEFTEKEAAAAAALVAAGAISEAIEEKPTKAGTKT